jgi:hypothetical protein
MHELQLELASCLQVRCGFLRFRSCCRINSRINSGLPGFFFLKLNSQPRRGERKMRPDRSHHAIRTFLYWGIHFNKVVSVGIPAPIKCNEDTPPLCPELSLLIRRRGRFVPILPVKIERFWVSQENEASPADPPGHRRPLRSTTFILNMWSMILRAALANCLFSKGTRRSDSSCESYVLIKN